MFESALVVLALLVGGAFALLLSAFLLLLVFMGSVVTLGYAAEKGFVGYAAYGAAWVFLFPLMLAASLIVGIIAAREQARLDRPFIERRNKLEREARALDQEQTRRIGPLLPGSTAWRVPKPRAEKPPENPADRYKWANRLPPYDD